MKTPEFRETRTASQERNDDDWSDETFCDWRVTPGLCTNLPSSVAGLEYDEPPILARPKTVLERLAALGEDNMGSSLRLGQYSQQHFSENCRIRRFRESLGTLKSRNRCSDNATVGQLVQPTSFPPPAPAPGPRGHTSHQIDALGLKSCLESSHSASNENDRPHSRAQKGKIKTRPAKAATEPPEQTAESENLPLLTRDSQIVPSPPVISISATSRDLFARMLVTDPSNRKPVHFEEFVAAMVDAGFSPKRCGRSAGSAVTFKDKRTDAGSIVFHCPHPDPRVDHNKLRTWGGRLNKKFGWEIESLMEREK
ncbi:hypothetical protein Slin14017_G097580 [Septoria linicola]|nr:hypothetical protein Slin14017_G097580 [Septoria linicola]